MAGIDEKGIPRCCFCGQPENKVARMLYGNGAYICDECVELCYQMLVNDGTLSEIPERPSRGSHGEEEQTPILKPAEMKAILDEYVIGQDTAKVALSVAVYNHYKRIYFGGGDAVNQTTGAGLIQPGVLGVVIGTSGNVSMGLDRYCDNPNSDLQMFCNNEPGRWHAFGCPLTSGGAYRYVLGSVLSQVLLHQSVIGLETKAALDKYGIKPDIIIGCAGGGSNLGGLISPFVGEMLRGEADYKIIAVEPASCPSLTRGVFKYDFCDTGKICPMAKMYTLGNGFIPSANHAGGLRYHGMSSIVSQLYHDGMLEARSVEQTAVFEAAELFARCEGILPAPESSHAIRVAIDEAVKCKENNEAKNIVIGLTGTGYFDMVAYGKYNDGEMSDVIPTDEDLQRGFATIPSFPGNE